MSLLDLNSLSFLLILNNSLFVLYFKTTKMLISQYVLFYNSLFEFAITMYIGKMLLEKFFLNPLDSNTAQNNVK